MSCCTFREMVCFIVMIMAVVSNLCKVMCVFEFVWGVLAHRRCKWGLKKKRKRKHTHTTRKLFYYVAYTKGSFLCFCRSNTSGVDRTGQTNFFITFLLVTCCLFSLFFLNSSSISHLRGVSKHPHHFSLTLVLRPPVVLKLIFSFWNVKWFYFDRSLDYN